MRGALDAQIGVGGEAVVNRQSATSSEFAHTPRRAMHGTDAEEPPSFPTHRAAAKKATPVKKTVR